MPGGSIASLLAQFGVFNEALIQRYTQQILQGVAYLHEKGIVHRDIKPDNLVFVTKMPDSPIKLIDFGYAGYCTEKQPLRGLCGTPDYAAPEILTWYVPDKSTRPNGTTYAQPVDMWSVGVVLYILLCGFPPFTPAGEHTSPLRWSPCRQRASCRHVHISRPGTRRAPVR